MEKQARKQGGHSQLGVFLSSENLKTFTGWSLKHEFLRSPVKRALCAICFVWAKEMGKKSVGKFHVPKTVKVMLKCVYKE